MSEAQYQELLKNRGRALPTPAPKEKKQNKYNAEKTWVDGICFDSKKEAEYYKQLTLLQRAGLIFGFARQCEFVLSEGTDKDNRCISYIADFIVFYTDGTTKIIDVKGVETAIFKQKAKLFKNKYPFLKLEIEK
jgi:hypothetical protein